LIENLFWLVQGHFETANFLNWRRKTAGVVTVSGKLGDNLAPQFHLEGMKKDGLQIPKPSSAVDYVEVAA
jgi:hypothetical protein